MIQPNTQLSTPLRMRNTAMPDIAHETAPTVQGRLDAVGMAEIEMPVRYRVNGERSLIPARITANVSLDDGSAKGIHMSRLYLSLERALESEELSIDLLYRLCQEFLESHVGLSNTSRVSVEFELPTKRPALKSDNSGWRQYPISLSASIENGQCVFELGVKVLYSSTCPCSAALARQLIQEQFTKDFEGAESMSAEEVLEWLSRETSICATPHSQRSEANIRLRFSDTDAVLNPLALIDMVEESLQTAVQAAVKRQDEQEFAKRNGHNLMFCEDAGRRVRSVLEDIPGHSDYWARLSHMESLHPHDAVSTICKGIQGGLSV